tara:strand:- start:2000 stop:2308 length:309 start_codon:yes stop_codon:yes gene_type:complete
MNNHIFKSYIDNITQYYGITQEEMFSEGKTQANVEPRHLFFYLCSLKDISIVTIQRFLQEQGHSPFHHTSIVRAIRKINQRVENHPEYDALVYKMQTITANV